MVQTGGRVLQSSKPKVGLRSKITTANRIRSIGLSTRLVLDFSTLWRIIAVIKLYSHETTSLLNRRPDPPDLHSCCTLLSLTSTLDALASHDLPSLRNHVREENITP